MRIKRPDNKNAQSMMESAENEMNFILTLKPTEQSSQTIIRTIYEAFRILGDALLVSKGIESTDHLEPINELIKLNVKTERSLNLLDNLRRLRHNINYYGYKPSIEELENAISLAKNLFEPLLKEVKKRNI